MFAKAFSLVSSSVSFESDFTKLEKPGLASSPAIKKKGLQ